MPNAATPMQIKAQLAANKYPNDFRVLPCGNLTCDLCEKTVACCRKFLIDNHRNTAIHEIKRDLGEMLLLQSHKVYSRLIFST